MTQTTSRTVIAHNLEALDQGLELLASLPAELYGARRIESPDLPALGPHFRHCIEFYRCFLGGLETSSIDYSARERDPGIEECPHAATAALVEIRARLAAIATQDLDRPVEVRLDVSVDETDEHSRSTISRELQFLLSHTVHHYAYLGLILQVAGQAVHPEFGIAPSTLAHRRREAAQERPQLRESECAR